MSEKTLTLEEYKEVGTEMTFLEKRMTALYIKVANGNGVNKTTTKQLEEALKKFGHTRSKLEDLMFKTYPSSGVGIFYGNTSLPADIKIIEK